MPITSLKNCGFFIILLVGSKAVIAQSSLMLLLQVAGTRGGVNTIFSYPFSADLSENCIKINFGLVAYKGFTRIGNFMEACQPDTRSVKYTIQLFPNPAHDIAVLRSNRLVEGNPYLSLAIFNAAGQQLLSFSITAEQLFAGIKLPIASLPAGLYFIRITTMNIRLETRFIRLK